MLSPDAFLRNTSADAAPKGDSTRDCRASAGRGDLTYVARAAGLWRPNQPPQIRCTPRELGAALAMSPLLFRKRGSGVQIFASAPAARPTAAAMSAARTSTSLSSRGPYSMTTF